MESMASSTSSQTKAIDILNEQLTRQHDIIPESILGERITIIGAGATGSRIAFDLAKSGFTNLEVWDFDKVDTVNLNTQFYKLSDVGKRKVTALAKNIEDFTGYRPETRHEKYEGQEVFTGIVVCALDSMEGRRTLWEHHVEKGVNTRYIIDPRMGAEMAQLFVVNPMDTQEQGDYDYSIIDDADAEEAPCTARATAYTAGLTAGLVVNTIKQILTEQPYIQSMMWNIKGNELEMWTSDREKKKQVKANPNKSSFTAKYGDSERYVNATVAEPMVAGDSVDQEYTLTWDPPGIRVSE